MLPDLIVKYHLHTPETNITSLFFLPPLQCTLSPLEPSGYHAAQPLSLIIPYCAPNMSPQSARGLQSFCFLSAHNKVHDHWKLSLAWYFRTFNIVFWRVGEGGLCSCFQHIYFAVFLQLQYVCCHFWYCCSARRDSGYMVFLVSGISKLSVTGRRV